MNPNSNASRASEVWTRFVGFFGADSVERKFGLTPPAEWVAMLGRLKDFEIDRGVRRLAYSGKGHVPSLPEFTRMCRAVGDDGIEEGPQLIALPAPDSRKFDGWDLTANNRLLKYVVRRLTDKPRAWGAPGSTRQNELTQIAVAYKNAWAQDMRESDMVDAVTGELLQASRAEQDSTWIACMGRAEADIAMVQMQKKAA